MAHTIEESVGDTGITGIFEDIHTLEEFFLTEHTGVVSAGDKADREAWISDLPAFI